MLFQGAQGTDPFWRGPPKPVCFGGRNGSVLADSVKNDPFWRTPSKTTRFGGLRQNGLVLEARVFVEKAFWWSDFCVTVVKKLLRPKLHFLEGRPTSFDAFWRSPPKPISFGGVRQNRFDLHNLHQNLPIPLESV